MEQLIRQWAYDRNLHGGHPHTQFLKMVEEQGELAEALVKKRSMDDIQDAIGDVFVTLVILAQQLDTSVDECAKIAYDTIKDRQGMTIDGTFIKSENLAGCQKGHYYDTTGQGD